VIDRDDWNEQELLEGDSYATTCNSVLTHVVGDLGTIEVMLPHDKRAVVEITALLRIAAQIAQQKLGIGADDFAVSACDVFMRTHHS
jgi:hypothetical protein